jgi:predicted nucleic acid-binding protein
LSVFIPFSNANWLFANNLVSDIDPKDIIYIAYAKQIKCKLWMGDKKLINGLEMKNYRNTLTTDNLFEIRNNRLISCFLSIK